MEAGDLSLLLPERLDHAHAVEDGVERAVELAARVPDPVVAGVDALPEEGGGGDHERRRHQGHQRKLPVQGEQQQPHGDDLDELSHEAAGGLHDQPLELFGVLHDAAHELPGAVAVVVGDRQPHQVAEQLRAQVVGDLCADGAAQPQLDRLHEPVDQVGAEQQGDHPHEQRDRLRLRQHRVARLSRRQHAVGDGLDELRRQQLHADGDQHQPHHQRGPPGVGTHQPEHPAEQAAGAQAPPACLPRRLQPDAAGRAEVGLLPVLLADDQRIARHPCLQLGRHPLEQRRRTVRVRQDLHRGILDHGLQEPAADPGPRADVVDLFARHGDAGSGAAISRSADRGQPIAFHDEVHRFVGAGQVEIGPRHEQGGARIDALRARKPLELGRQPTLHRVCVGRLVFHEKADS